MRIRKLYILFLLSVFFVCIAMSCGPGPRHGTRPSERILRPLLRQQYVPHLSEGTVGASGPSEGRIYRNTPKYRKLERNYNPDILFREDEEDGSARIMTKRCKDKVDLLSTLVRNRWAGVSLQVISAWDGDGLHPRGSLHYEGRAVDIKTSDDDTTKYGLLARLAVEAGFDWVFYESKFHVHASVRADGADAVKYGGCFDGTGTAMNESGALISMNNLQIGDKVLAVDRWSGLPVFSEVILFMDKQPTIETEYVEIRTHQQTIRLTSNHLIFVTKSNNSNTFSTKRRAVYASDIIVGDFVYLTLPISGRFEITPSRVEMVATVTRSGVYAPLTAHGTIVVDATVASCYGFINSETLAHAALYPVRAFPSLRTAKRSSGIHWYAKTLADMARNLFPTYWIKLN
uniref:Hedgehog protein n=1 Tax=Ciona savignyi TaxID=51511 RepID=H2ZHI5_CIOSA